MGGLDQDVVGLAVEERERPVAHVHVLGQGPQHRAHHVAQVEALVQETADLVEQREFADPALVFRKLLVIRHASTPLVLA